MNILCTGNKSPVQKGFLKNSTSDLLLAQRIMGGLYNFCNFVIIFCDYSYIKLKMICEKAIYFTDSEMVKYYQKTCSSNSKFKKTKNYVTNYARCTTLKNISYGLHWDI